MEKKRAVLVFDMPENKHTQYLWRHIWLTNKIAISSAMESKNISIVANDETNDLIAIPKQIPADSMRIHIKRTFNGLEAGQKAQNHRVDHFIQRESALKMQQQLASEEVGIYTDVEDDSFWFVGDIHKVEGVILRFDKALLETKLDNSGKDPVDDKYERVLDPVLVPLLEEEKAIMWLYSLLQMKSLAAQHVAIRYDNFDFHITVTDMHSRKILEKEIRDKINSLNCTFASKKLSFSPQMYQFLIKSEVHNCVNSKINIITRRPECVWFQGAQNMITVYSKNEYDVSKLCESIVGVMKETEVLVPSRFFSTNTAKKQLDYFEKKYLGKVSVRLSSTCTTVGILYVDDFWSPETCIKNMYATEHIPVYKSQQESCKVFFAKQKFKWEDTFAVNIDEVENEYGYGWQIQGEKSLVRSAYQKLGKLAKNIHTKTSTYISDRKIDSIQSVVDVFVENKSCHVSFSKEVPLGKSYIDLRENVYCRSMKTITGSSITVYKCKIKDHAWLKKDCLVVWVVPKSEQTSTLNIRPSDDTTCFYASLYLDEWKGNERKERQHLCDSLNILMDFVMKPGQHPFMSLAFDMIAANKVNWPENKYLNEILASIERKKPSIPIHLYQHSEEKFERTCTKIHEWCVGVAGRERPRVQIKLVKGELAKQQSDVLVNSTSNTLDLSKGVVSNSLLVAAGPGMQQECYKYRGNYSTIFYSDVVMTGAYGLKCRSVFHGALPFYSDDNRQYFEKFIQNCLTKAVELNMKTISFPALGAGKLGYPPATSAKKMFQTVKSFLATYPAGSLSEIQFVIYPSDKKVIDAFEMEKKLLDQNDGFEWIHSTVANTQFLSFAISVTGDDESIMQRTFEEVQTILTQKDTNTSLGTEKTSGNIQSEPAEQTMQRNETKRSSVSDNENPHMTRQNSKQGMIYASNSNDENLDNTFMPQESFHRQASTENTTETDGCCIDVLISKSIRDKPSELYKTFSKYGVEENNIIWCPDTPLKARLTLKSQTDANQLIEKMKYDTSYDLTKSMPDAVVNIKARLNPNMGVFLKEKRNRMELERQSGVKIILNDEVTVLTGDLTEISSARDILLKWKTNYGIPTEKNRVGGNLYCAYEDDVDVDNNKRNQSDVDTAAITLEDQEKVLYKKETGENSSDNVKNPLKTSYKSDQQASSVKNENNEFQDKSQNSHSEIHRSAETEVRNPKQASNISSVTPSSPDHHQKLRKSADSMTNSDVPKRDHQANAKVSKVPGTLEAPLVDRTTKPDVKSNLYLPQEESVMMVTKEGISVYVYQADIFRLRTNCIVNSSNKSMNHEHGLSAFIERKAGQQMIDQCKRYIQENGVLKTNGVCRTSAGNLSHYQYILHVNAPKWRDNIKGDEFSADLSAAVQECLIHANGVKMTSVALPAISSGYNAAPAYLRSKAYTEGVVSFSRIYQKSLVVKEVHFVDKDEDVVNHIKAAFLYAVIEPTQNIIEKRKKIPKEIQEIFVSQARPGGGAGSSLQLTIPERKLMIIVCDSGLITSLEHPHLRHTFPANRHDPWNKTETAVVITENKAFNGNSHSSKKCLERGGNTYRKKYTSHCTQGKKKKVAEIVEVFGDETLDFYHIFISVLPSFSDNLKKSPPEETKFFRKIDECLRNALTTADKYGVKHLSMPVLCSDLYDFSPEWFLKSSVSHMISEIKYFAQKRIGKHFMIVHIVTNANEKVFRLFHEVMSKEPLMETNF